jgi:hypothetical protein
MWQKCFRIWVPSVPVSSVAMARSQVAALHFLIPQKSKKLAENGSMCRRSCLKLIPQKSKNFLDF